MRVRARPKIGTCPSQRSCRHHRGCSRSGRSGRDWRDHPRHARLVLAGPAVALAFAVIVAYHALALIRKILRRLRPATADSKART